MSEQYTYKVTVTDDIKESTPQRALSCFLARLRDEETEAKVVKLSTNEVVFIECQSGEAMED